MPEAREGTATLSGTPTNAEVGANNVVLEVSDADDCADDENTSRGIRGEAGGNLDCFLSDKNG